jgi:hypothetical protein
MEETIPYRLGGSILLYCVSTFLKSSQGLKLTVDSTFASSVYTPGVFDTAKYFNVSTEAAILPLTLYVLGRGSTVGMKALLANHQ